MKLSRREKRKLSSSDERQDEKEVAPAHEVTATEGFTKKKFNPKPLLIAVGVVILVVIAYGVYSYSRPGPYDNFAKCLTQKGAVMYGAMDWCKYTQGQKAMFGKSFRYVNYEEHTKLPGIKSTPTWVIDGKWYEKAQSFDRLSQITGCQI